MDTARTHELPDPTATTPQAARTTELPTLDELIEGVRFKAWYHATQLGFSEQELLDIEVAVRSYCKGTQAIEPTSKRARHVAQWFFIEACYLHGWKDLAGQKTKWYAPHLKFAQAIEECQEYAWKGCVHRGFTQAQTLLCMAIIRSYCYGSIISTDDADVAEQARWRFAAACEVNKWHNLPGQRTDWYDETLEKVLADFAKAREARKAAGNS